jgi:uncharacterized protein
MFEFDSPQKYLRQTTYYLLDTLLPANRYRYLGRALTVLFLITAFGCSFLNQRIFLTRKVPATTASKFTPPFEDIWFKSADGTLLNGWLIDGAPGSPRILFFHGNDSNLNDNLEYLKLLHDHGFTLFIFDYRGYGKSQGEPLYENDLYQDARGAIAYLKGRGWRPKSTIFFGQSLGGAVALQMALEEQPAGLVMESTFTSMGEMVHRLMPAGLYLVSWWTMNLRFNNLDKISKVKVPLLLIHGDQDPIAPVEMARRLFERAKKPKMLQVMYGGGHCDTTKLDTGLYLASWDRFLNGALRAAGYQLRQTRSHGQGIGADKPPG